MFNFVKRLLGRDSESEFKVVNGKIVKDQEEVEEQSKVKSDELIVEDQEMNNNEEVIMVNKEMVINDQVKKESNQPEEINGKRGRPKGIRNFFLFLKSASRSKNTIRGYRSEKRLSIN